MVIEGGGEIFRVKLGEPLGMAEVVIEGGGEMVGVTLAKLGEPLGEPEAIGSELGMLLGKETGDVVGESLVSSNDGKLLVVGAPDNVTVGVEELLVVGAPDGVPLDGVEAATVGSLLGVLLGATLGKLEPVGDEVGADDGGQVETIKFLAALQMVKAWSTVRFVRGISDSKTQGWTNSQTKVK
eukprot:scaffold771_cov170-Amphora_coffeaeformis.AAC.4